MFYASFYEIMLKLGFGKKNDNIETPKDFYNELNEEFKFTFDPCPLGGESIFDGLEIDWGECNYVNPPFSKVKKWLKKGVTEMKKGKKSVFLLTLRTHTKYWRKHIIPFASEIRILNSSLTFQNFQRKFPMSLVLVVFDPNKQPKQQIVKKETYKYIQFI